MMAFDLIEQREALGLWDGSKYKQANA